MCKPKIHTCKVPDHCRVVYGRDAHTGAVQATVENYLNASCLAERVPIRTVK